MEPTLLRDGNLKFCYYGVPTTNKKRLTGFARVYTHDKKPEVQSNEEVKLKGYSSLVHELPVSEVCQKEIQTHRYFVKKKAFFKLKESDVVDVLKYAPLS